MATTLEDIRGWFKRGMDEGDQYMLVVCDTYDWSDYPVYSSLESLAAKYDAHNGRNMQKIMEIYDLKADPEPQFRARRARSLPPDFDERLAAHRSNP